MLRFTRSIAAAAAVMLAAGSASATTIIEDGFTAGDAGDQIHGLAPDTVNVPGGTWSFAGNADVWGIDSVTVEDHAQEGRVADIPQFDTGAQITTGGMIGGEVTLSARVSVPTGPNMDAHRAIFLGTWDLNHQDEDPGGLANMNSGDFRGIGINREGEIVTRDTDWRQTGLFIDDFDDGAFHDFSFSFDAASGDVLSLTVDSQSFDFMNDSAVGSPFSGASLNHVGFGSPGGGAQVSSFIAIPEPASLTLVGLGGAVLLLRRRGRA